MKKHSVVGGLIVLMLTMKAAPSRAAIPPEERAALIALYNATNGDSWTNNSGWKEPPLHTDGFALPGTESYWYGIDASLEHVIDIAMVKNNLNGTIPPEIGNLSNLHRFYLPENRLSGSIPPELGNLSNLHWLYLEGNRLSGNIPSQLGNLSNLTYLRLSINQLSGSIPPELGNLGNLQYFILSSNQLSGSIPPALGNLNNLTQLVLNRNQLSGDIPPELENLDNLMQMFLDSNQLSGGIPPELGNLGNLQRLELGYNQLSGSIPPELVNASSLQNLNLSGNQLSGSIPPELGNLGNLETLSIYTMQLSGTIPPELGNLSKLHDLNLKNNKLSGSIPPELGNLSHLENLIMSKNHLSGSIPPELGNLSNLQRVDLSWNELSGSIPPELGNLGNLQRIDLSRNHLSGSIPAELGNINFLNGLKLNGNQLSSEIPTSLINLTHLMIEYTDISYNALYAHDDMLRNFLKSKDPDWEITQTIAPESVSAETISSFSIQVSWTPIIYSDGYGGYEVYYSTTFGGPWTYAGITADKAATSYEVTGLNPGTTYYFVVRTRTRNHSMNDNTVFSEYSEETSAVTLPGNTTYILTVQTSPDTALITVTPNDINGNGDGLSNFTRTYYEGTIVTIIAPTEHNGKVFLEWTIEGASITSQTIQVTMDSDHKAKASYTKPPDPGLSLSTSKIDFDYTIGGELPPSQTFLVTINGDPVDWTASVDVTWLQVNPTSGFGSAEVTASVDPTGLTKGNYKGTITVSAPGTENSSQSVDIKLKVSD